MTDHVEFHGPNGSPTLLFIHGAGGNRKMWLPEVDELGDRYRLLLVDLPGHGALIDQKYDYRQSVEVVEQAIEDHTDGSVVLVGLSLGGYVAMGVRHDRVRAMVLSGSTIGQIIVTLTPANSARRLSNRPCRPCFEAADAVRCISGENPATLDSTAMRPRRSRSVPNMARRRISRGRPPS